MGFVFYFNAVIGALLTVLLSYQAVYLFVPFLKKKKFDSSKEERTFGVLIAARNEEDVIGQLIQSIKKQDYPANKIKIFVVADNCSDRTAQVAKDAGAIVFERFNDLCVGKGYALEYLIQNIEAIKLDEDIDGYFIFDADNLLDSQYVKNMNALFGEKYKIITSYRNAKNFGDNWLSASYGIWFLRESVYLNYARMLLGTSCAVSGTGYLFAKEILQKCGGWKFFLLTEDIEFTTKNIVEGEKVGYAHDAIFYDEHPTSFGVSWFQRERWAKGYLQVLGKYGGKLLKGTLKGSFSCYDIGMAFAPSIVLTVIGIIFNLGVFVFNLVTGGDLLSPLITIGGTTISTALLMFIMGAVATISEWKRIRAKSWQKIVYTFAFPIFVLSYFPIAVTAACKKVKWKPIKHSKTITIDEFTAEEKPDVSKVSV